MTDIKYDEFIKKVLIVFGVFAVGVILIWLFINSFQLLLLLFASILFGVFILGLARIIAQKTKLSTQAAVWMVIAGIIILTAGVNFFIGHRISQEFAQLSQALNDALKEVKNTIQQHKYLQQLNEQFNFKNFLEGKQGKLFGIFTSIIGVVGSLLVFIALSLFIATSPDTYTKGLLTLFPKNKQDRANEVLDKLSYGLFKWLSGRIIDMVIVGVATGIGLWILGIPLALSLGILTAILSFIPNLGPVLSLLPPALLAFTQGGNMVLYVVLLFVGIQLIESYLLTPFIQKKAVQIPPVLLLMAQLLFGKFGGILGLLLATPITVMLMVLIKSLYVKDVLKQNVLK